MKKAIIIIGIILTIATSALVFFVFFYVAGKVMMPVWGCGIHNIVLFVPAAWAAMCYESGMISFLKSFSRLFRTEWSYL